MIDLLYVSWNRLRYTQLSFAALLANTDWSQVARLYLADDGSTDGTREWLDAARDAVPVASEFLPAPFGGPVAAVNLYLVRATPWVEVFAKIDNDTMTPPGWLPELLGLLERHPEVDLLGMAPDIGPPQSCPYGARTVRYATFVDGNGLWRRRAFEGRPRPQPRYVDKRQGFTQWQLGHPAVVKAWAAPDLPVFQLDMLRGEPWRALAAAYVAAGWQRPWPPYDAGAGAYWEWAALDEVFA